MGYRVPIVNIFQSESIPEGRTYGIFYMTCTSPEQLVGWNCVHHNEQYIRIKSHTKNTGMSCPLEYSQIQLILDQTSMPELTAESMSEPTSTLNFDFP
jgi:N-acetylmuramoyl-L-alanine amidase CwlA